MSSAPPPFPEAALRAVLAAAVAAWARGADDTSAGDEPRRRLYVDAFAGAEFQIGTGVARTPSCGTRAGAAVGALRSCAGPAPPASCAFVEEDPAHLQRVYAELEDPLGGEHIHATRGLSALEPGGAALIEAPFAAIAAELRAGMEGAEVFAFAAPSSARALPWDALRPLLALPGATVLVRFPHADFEKQSRHTGPLADLPGFARRIVEGCSALLADPKHAWLPAWRTDARDATAPPLARVLQRFRERIDGVAGDRIVKPMQLETADGAPAWLFLVTPDPAVAMAVNAAVRAAGLIDRAASLAAEPTPVSAPQAAPADGIPSPEPSSKPSPLTPSHALPSAPPSPPSPLVAPADAPAFVAAEPLDLFPEQLPRAPVPATVTRPDAVMLASTIEARFARRTVTWREVLAVFAASDATPAELKAAMAVIRRGGRASYRSLKDDGDEIEFPPEPVVRTKTARRRKVVADEGFFAADEEGE